MGVDDSDYVDFTDRKDILLPLQTLTVPIGA